MPLLQFAYHADDASVSQAAPSVGPNDESLFQGNRGIPSGVYRITRKRLYLYHRFLDRYRFPGDPAAGIPNRFYSETTIIQLGFVASREILSGLRLAIQPAPTYGRIRAHYPGNYDLSGGVAGISITYRLD